MISRISSKTSNLFQKCRYTISTPFTFASPATKVATTTNGVRVATEFSPSETATIGVWIDAGSRYENAKNNGVAHFLEHMAFKGTSKRTQQQLEKEIENMGGHLNAYTSREQTVYYAKVFHSDVPKAMEIISDILQNSTLEPAAIERERGVILREREEVNKQYEEQILDHLHETAFMGTSLGRTILGSEENIRSISRQDIVDYIDNHYTANRFVIAGAGNVNHDSVVELTEKYFGGLSKAPKNGAATTMEPAIFTGSDKRMRFDSMSEAHIAIAFQGASWTSPNAVPLMIMQTLLGSWDRSSPLGRYSASKLAQACSEFNLCQSFMSFNTCYKDTGLFGVYMVAPDNKLDDSMWYILDSMVRMCHTITEDEVERAKVQLKANILMNLDTHAQVAEDIGRQMLVYGRRMSPAEIFARINAVTLEDIQATANTFINDEDHALAAVGPIFELPDYNWIRRRSFWNRY